MTVIFTPVEDKNEILVSFTNVYLSYPYLFERRKDGVDDEGNKVKGKYTANFCFSRDDTESKADAIAIHRKCKELEKTVLKTSVAADKLCLRDGRQLEESMHPYFVLKSSDGDKPDVVDRRLKPITAEDELIYAGCVVNGVVKLWVQNHPKYGKRINANLLKVQFVKHSQRWGGRTSVKTEDVLSDISGDFDDDEYTGGPAGGNGLDHESDDGFGDSGRDGL